MKNLKMKPKLIAGFLSVIILAAVVGITGITGMMSINKTASDMYEYQTQPLANLSKVIEELQLMRVNMRGYIIYAEHDNMSAVETSRTAIEGYKKTMEENIALFAAIIKNPEIESLFAESRKFYEGDFQKCLEGTYAMAKAGDSNGAYALLAQHSAGIDKMANNLNTCLELKIADAKNADLAGDATFAGLLATIIAVLIIAIAFSMMLALYLARMISKPLIVLEKFMLRAAETGDLTLSKNDVEAIEKYSMIKDEVGTCINSTAKFVRRLTDVSEGLETFARGDLTVDLEILSDQDTMGNSLHHMSANLNDMLSEINASSHQVSVGSDQVADSAQDLAQGATEQAASAEQLASSVTEIAHKTKENAKMADKAAKLADTIMASAEEGSRRMNDMMTAVNEINDASHSIKKIIKTIDEIAFQTNILALNAAVEAARAGEHGRGFAVVAEEVRSLASKSAEAAKYTDEIILSTINKTELGTRLADETATSLKEIVTGINESSLIAGEIAKSAEEQSMAFAEINIGIDQVSQVVQQNAATAQESAAAAQEINAQTTMLQELISRFKLKHRGTEIEYLSPQNKQNIQSIQSAKSQHIYANASFDKYEYGSVA